MRRGCKAWVLAIVAAFAFASEAAARAPSRPEGTVSYRHAASRHHRTYVRSMRGGHAAYLRHSYAVSRGHRTRFAALVGDPESGLGFYPLPMRYRVGAWRYRMRHQRPPWQNPVLFAIAADAARYYYDWIPGPQNYRYGVFSPYDGVGTPFFGGYYGPAGDDDEERPFPFGRPYPN